MKGKDPRDAHFITSRICGICGDNHAVCSCYAQQMAYGVKPPPLAEWIVNLGEAAEYIFDHIIFQDNLVFVDFCEQMVKETNPGVWAKAQNTAAPGRRVARLQDDRGHHDVVQPVHGRDVPRGAAHEPDRARDDLPDGGAPRAPVHDLPRRRRHDGDADAADGLPEPAAALPGLHQEGRRDERRRLRLLLRGAAGLRGGRAPAGAPELLGRVQQPRLLHLRLQDDERLGQRDVRHPGHRRRRRARHDRPRRHQPRHPDPARLLLLRGLAGRRRGLRAQGPARQPGRQAPPVEPDDDAEAAEARPRRRQLLVGDEPALVRPAHRRQPGDGHRRRRARRGCGRRRWPTRSTSRSSTRPGPA